MPSLQDPTPSPPASAQEPCPTPLEWRAVVEEFRCLRTVTEVPRIDGRPVLVTTFGTGRPLYICGPATGDCELFSLIAWLLKDDFCCVFVEPPAIAWPIKRLTELQQWSNAVLSAANELQHERFTVVGVGAGSTVALDLCLNAPERVASLILLHGGPRLALSWLERGFCTYGSILPGALGTLPGWRGLQLRNHRPWFPPFDFSRFEFLAQNLARTPIAQASRRTLLWAGLDFRAQLSAIRQPVLLVQTEGDGPSIKAGMQEFQDHLPQAQVESLHSTGQHACLTHPHRIAKLIRTFLDGTASRQA